MRTRRSEGTAGAKPGFRSREFLVEGSRAFVTIGPGSEVWTVPDVMLDSSLALEGDGVRGAFVRIEAPETASESAIDWVRSHVEAAGALRVTVLPRRRAAAVLSPREKKPHRAAREVVSELVGEAREDDRAALGEMTESIMAKVGI